MRRGVARASLLYRALDGSFTWKLAHHRCWKVRVVWFLGGINYSNVMTKARKVQRTQKAGECGKQTKEKEGLWSLWGAPSSPCSSKLFTHSLKGNHHLTFLRFFNITFFTNRNMNETFRLPGYKTLYPQMYEPNKTRSSEMNIAPGINNHFVGLVHSVRLHDIYFSLLWEQAVNLRYMVREWRGINRFQLRYTVCTSQGMLHLGLKIRSHSLR